MIYSEKVENFHPNTCMGTRMLDLTILLSSVSSSISIQSHCCTQSISILRTQQQQNIIQGDTKEQYTGWHRRTIYRGLRSNENKTIQRVIQKNNIQDDTEEQHTGWHRRTIYRGLRSNENKTIQRVIKKNNIQDDTEEQHTGWHSRTIYRGLRSNENKTIQRVIQKNNIQDDTEEQHTGGWEELQHRTSHYWQESLANAKVARDSLARQRRILTWNWHSRSF